MTTRRGKFAAATLAAAVLLAGGARLVRSAPKGGSTITVRVLNAKVMSEPKFIGATAASVSRGDHLTFEEAQKDWYKVKTGAGGEGWIHKSNVTETDVKLSSHPGGSGSGVSQDEVELAGRGFTPEVEKQYRGKHPNLDFSHVDAIEKTSVDGAEYTKFVQEGAIGGVLGGAK